MLWVRNTLHEYLRYGFVEKVKEIPYCVMLLKVKATGDKMALIYDMSVLNAYIEKNKFKLEGVGGNVQLLCVGQFCYKI